MVTALIVIAAVLSLFFGGFDLIYTILDVFSWVDTLFYFNVDYPINVYYFFQYFSWTEMIQLPTFFSIVDEDDPYF